MMVLDQSYLAEKCLEDLVHEVEKANPKIALIIQTCMYMDDLWVQINTIKEAVLLREAVHSVLSNVTFVLQKYQSNSFAIL